MSIRSVREFFSTVMEQRGWSGTRLGRELDISQQYVSFILNGRKDPIPDWLRVGAERVGYELQFVPIRKDDPVKRRTLLAGAIAAPLVHSAKLGPYDDPTFLHDAAVSLARKQWENGGMETLSIASRHYEHLRPIISGKDPKLQEAASHLARQIAFAYHDAGRFGAAENAGGLAADLAVRAGNVEARALAFSCLSRNAFAQGAGDQAVGYAKSGLANSARALSPLSQAWLKMRLGCGLALVKQQEKEARKALDSALEFDGLPSNYDPGDMVGNAGYGMYKLGRHEEAYAHLDQAVSLMGEWPALQANCLGWQIHTALSTSDPLRAADRIFALARVVPLVSSARVDRHVSDVYVASRRWEKVPTMRDARDQLCDVMPRAMRDSLARIN